MGANKVELVCTLVFAGANVDGCSLVLAKPPFPEIRYILSIAYSVIEYSAMFCEDKLHQILLSASREDHLSISCDAILNAADKGTQALSKYLAEGNGKASSLEKKMLESYYQGNESAVLSLLAIGIDPNAQSSLHYLFDSIGTALASALRAGNIRLVTILLEAGENVNAPLIPRAAAECDLEMLQFILKKGADAKTYGEPTLVWAGGKDMLDVVQLLLLFGVDVNAVSEGSTVLGSAVIHDSRKVVKLLLDAGADVNKPSNGGTAIQIAASERNIEVVKILLNAGADINVPVGTLPALQRAIESENLEVVRILLNAGEDVNALISPPTSLPGGQSVLQSAIIHIPGPLKIELIQILLTAVANVNVPEESRCGATIIQSAIAEGNIELVQILLRARADVNSPP